MGNLIQITIVLLYIQNLVNMANMCDNDFYAYGSEETIKVIEDFLIEEFNAYTDNQGDELFAEFESRWTFPESEMNDLYNKITDKKELWMRCLSVEYGNMYHALYGCDEDGWKEY